jgi:hypothetical protein
VIKLTYELERLGDYRCQLQEEAMTKSAPHDQPATNTNEAEFELTAEDLDRVVGGGKTHSHSTGGQMEFLTITMKHITVSSF